MADTKKTVARFKQFLDHVAAESTATIQSTVGEVSASPAPTSYEVVLGRFSDRLDDIERAELVSLFDKMLGT